MTFIERNGIEILIATGVLVLVWIAFYDPIGLISIAALPGIVGVFLLTLYSLRNNRIAVLILVFVTVFLLQAVFRVRQYDDKGIDFQVVLKLAVWALAIAIAFFHSQRWFSNILLPTNIPWILFLIWIFVTCAVSPSPPYSAGSTFTILGCLALSAYVFAVFEPFEVFATMVFAIFAFCVISIIVYFAIPSFGHFVYWQDGVRFISPRLAGIAGSANNMALLAAFGLVIMGLYPLEFYRLHKLLMPLAALVMLVTLVMTNSRTPLMMTFVILLGIFALNKRRIYFMVLAAALALIGAALILPIGNEVLMLLARHGNAEEVTSVTGRTEIWHAVLALSAEKPWTGYGYGSSVIILPQHEREVGFLTSHAHNLWLQLLLTTGWVGVILFSLSCVSIGLKAMITGNRIVIVMLAFVLLNGITESSGFTTLANSCTLAYAIAVTLPPLASSQEPQYEHAYYYPYQRRLS